MYAYLFINTEPGLARTVMESLVASKAVDRAAIVTGDFDVFARIDDISWDDLAERIVGSVQRIPGIIKTETALATEADRAALTIAVPKIPLRGMPARGEKHVALSFVRYAPDAPESVVDGIVRSDGVIAFAHVTGSYDAVVQVSGRTIDHIMRRVLKLRSVEGVASTNTKAVVASTPYVPEKRGKKR